ncbi:MAG: hypothetical protein K0R15_242 [Clostridiales bacterium]|jgi:hypothetical protein|nr:hypothetical protein [Clostridiales bacterium]
MIMKITKIALITALIGIMLRSQKKKYINLS